MLVFFFESLQNEKFHTYCTFFLLFFLIIICPMRLQTFEWQYIYWTFVLKLDIPAITISVFPSFLQTILIFWVFVRFNLQPALFCLILLCHIYFTASLASAICHTSSFILIEPFTVLSKATFAVLVYCFCLEGQWSWISNTWANLELYSVFLDIFRRRTVRELSVWLQTWIHYHPSMCAGSMWSMVCVGGWVGVWWAELFQTLAWVLSDCTYTHLIPSLFFWVFSLFCMLDILARTLHHPETNQ